MNGVCKQASRLGAWMLTLLALIAPTIARAGGGEDVLLNFTQRDMIYLYISLGFGVLAIVFGLYFRSKVTAVSPGDEKMQEVGAAIRDGALAYLAKQRNTITIFVALLGALLFAFYFQRFGVATSGYLVLAFILGVAASYIAGYVGMDMAVKANMRTAASALTSYKKALEVSFQAGAVAGLFTVGMGLLGATLIFLLAGKDAMKLLIGFGFGGSLAALFMRVGGGIYTKAADVGADLVGKVEAGIPEDDPRNPAVIADNVGDNVGDCAGMAADVFESYEVTLVAAIVLGAATAAIFPTDIWMKLILFALMARGVGILASILGIFSVRGSDDTRTDPLKAISSGFAFSAILAVLLTGGLAWFMMGGNPATGRLITTTELIPPQKFQRDEAMAIKKVQRQLAPTVAKVQTEINRVKLELGSKRPDKKVESVTAEELMADARVKALVDDFAAFGFKTVPAQGAPTDPAARNKEFWTEDEFKAALVQPLVGSKLDAAGVTVTPDPQKVRSELLVETTAIQQMAERIGEGMDQFRQRVEQAVMIDPNQELPALPRLDGFSPVDWTDERVKNASVQMPMTTPGVQPEVLGLAERFQSPKPEDALVVYQLEVTQKPPAMQGQAPQDEIVQTVLYGPLVRKDADKVITDAVAASNGALAVEKTAVFPVQILINRNGDFALGVGNRSLSNVPADVKEKGIRLEGPSRIQPTQMRFFKEDKATVTASMTTPNPIQGSAVQVGVLNQKVADWWRFFACILFGVLMAFAFERLTDYYVSTHRKPTREVAGVASAGPAPMIIQGFALGAESSVISLGAICISLAMPLAIFPPGEYGGYLLSFYGIALVGLGLLTTTAYILAMDTFGPISDNAQGVFEMSGAAHTHPQAAVAVQRLDAAGNTTKALTKGFAIATAVVAAVALFHSYVEGAKLTAAGMRLEVPEIFIGLLIGGAAPFLFSAFLINAVGRASFQLINEVRRQFRDDPGIMAGTSKPNYASCVAIVTAAAQKELLGPGILAIALPLFVAFGLGIGKEPVIVGGQEVNLVGAQALGGFLAGTILSGQLLAVMLSNSGGIWDNAKKLIEDGMHGGKGTEAHKAGVVCDTVGDPFKDTAGPALNPLIKVMNLVALLIAPAIIFPGNDEIRYAVAGSCLVALVVAFYFSKKGSLASEMESISVAQQVK